MSFEPLTPERRRAMTRRYLLDAAAIVFARDGFHGATLDEIAARAGFSKGAVYSNFKNKDELFVALLEDRIDRWYAITLDVLDAGPHDRADQLPRVRDLLGATVLLDEGDSWRALYLEFVLYAQRNPDAKDKLVTAVRRERARIQALIEREYQASGDSLPYSATALAVFNQALWDGLGFVRLVDPDAIDQQAIDTAIELLYTAMGVD